MSIVSWPVNERPREKLVARGAHTLSDAELLAIFLHTGVNGHTAVDLARRLLHRFGGLRQLSNADRKVICNEPGIGLGKYVQLQAALEFGRRYFAAELPRGSGLTSPSQARTFLRAQLRDRPHEVFCCLYLDTRHRVLEFEEMFRGTIDGASVHPREVVKAALARNAAAVIIAHNHPSGVAEPSAADEALTQRLKQALALVDIRLLDHFVVGDTEVVSLSERGLV
jgi:DNA repair protein RadC